MYDWALLQIQRIVIPLNIALSWNQSTTWPDPGTTSVVFNHFLSRIHPEEHYCRWLYIIFPENIHQKAIGIFVERIELRHWLTNNRAEPTHKVTIISNHAIASSESQINIILHTLKTAFLQNGWLHHAAIEFVVDDQSKIKKPGNVVHPLAHFVAIMEEFFDTTKVIQFKKRRESDSTPKLPPSSTTSATTQRPLSTEELLLQLRTELRTVGNLQGSAAMSIPAQMSAFAAPTAFAVPNAFAAVPKPILSLVPSSKPTATLAKPEPIIDVALPPLISTPLPPIESDKAVQLSLLPSPYSVSSSAAIARVATPPPPIRAKTTPDIYAELQREKINLPQIWYSNLHIDLLAITYLAKLHNENPEQARSTVIYPTAPLSFYQGKLPTLAETLPLSAHLQAFYAQLKPDYLQKNYREFNTLIFPISISRSDSYSIDHYIIIVIYKISADHYVIHIQDSYGQHGPYAQNQKTALDYFSKIFPLDPSERRRNYCMAQQSDRNKTDCGPWVVLNIEYALLHPRDSKPTWASSKIKIASARQTHQELLDGLTY